MSNFFPISKFGRGPIIGDFDSMIDAFFNEPLRRTATNNLSTVPAANVVSTNEGYTIQLAVPGYSRDDFSIACSNGALTVSMSSDDNSEGNWDGKLVRQEYSYSSFTRSWSLPDGASPTNITARYNSGILSVYVPVEDNTNGEVVISVD
jgi:HSP20 family protein